MPKSDRAGELLRIYVAEEQTHRGVLLWEWLLQQASALGMQGGSAFRAIGSFGRHHFLQEARFFELAGSTGIEVEFIAGDEEIERLLALVRTEGTGPNTPPCRSVVCSANNMGSLYRTGVRK